MLGASPSYPIPTELDDPDSLSHHEETQPFNFVRPLPLGLSKSVAEASIHCLNQLLADTLTLSSLYKKHHWQVSGPHFYSMHLLYDKHYEEQAALSDLLAERVQTLGGVSIAMAYEVFEVSSIPRCPKGRENGVTQIRRVLQAHEIILRQARSMAVKAAEQGDHGTNDLIVSNVIRLNELQVWFVAEHIQE
jgi:starvation-inducible DNA-binding protein